MIYNIDFDICALLINMVLLFCFYFKRNIPSMQNKVFLFLLWLGFLTTLMDILNIIVTSFYDNFPIGLNMMTLYLYYIFINMLPVVYAFYIITLTDTQNKIFKKRSGLLFVIPAVIIYFIIALNPFFHWLFYYDRQLQYHRGIGLFVLYGLAAYFLIYGLIYAASYRDIIPKNKRLALYSFSGLVAGPIIIQNYFPNVLLAMLGIAICTLLVSFTIQNPEELIDNRTGLFNRSAFLSMAAINYRNQKPFVVISVGIDNYAYFKRTFGAELMTSILREISHNLGLLPSKNKVLHYLENGHFVILLPESGAIKKIPEKVKELFEKNMGNGQMKVNLSAFICVISCPKDASTLDLLIEYVEYRDKNVEGDQAIVYASQLKRPEKSRVEEIELAVEHALATDSFEVYYQPIFSTQENKITSAEALIRLNDKNLGFIPPDEFIPITEKNGAIIHVGMVVFCKVCKFIASNNLEEMGIQYIELNLSVAQCMQKKLAVQLLETLAAYGLTTDCINLEITETAAAYSPETLAGNMNILANAGVKFSLDDYGTGFSNLSSMVELPFALVKLDKSMIWAMENERTQIAMRNTIAMLKQLKLGIVAEGVETIEQVNVLTDMGCDYLQGYYFSKPVPAGEFINIIAERRNRRSE